MGKPASDAVAFASRMAGDTGLDSGVLLAWMSCENNIESPRNGGNDGTAGVPENWLNIGVAGPVYRGSQRQIWQDTKASADASADFLSNKFGGWALGSINGSGILNTAAQSPQAQLNAIQKSGWISGTPGVDSYPGLNAAYSLYKGHAPAPSTTPFSAAANQSTGSGAFTVGDPTNPDEDYWTAVNRLGQEVNWYIYNRLDAPKNTIFIADGTALLAQKSIATIDRINDRDRVLYIDFTWDNTALEYKSQHRRKGRTSRRSAVAKVTSPTECQLHLVCNIDAFNPGDIITLVNCGAGNGPWLVAEVIRSIFQPYSELTLVPGITPITSNASGPNKDITDNLNSVAGSAGSGGNSVGAVTGTGDVGAAAAAAQQLSAMHVPYVWGGGHTAGAMDSNHPSGLDCSGAVSWVLHRAGMFDPSAAIVSGDFASSWGKAGQGRQLTIWANASHVFMEFNMPQGHYQLNTVSPSGGATWEPWSYSNADAGAQAAASGAFTPRHWPGT